MLHYLTICIGYILVGILLGILVINIGNTLGLLLGIWVIWLGVWVGIWLGISVINVGNILGIWLGIFDGFCILYI